jgi:esterase
MNLFFRETGKGTPLIILHGLFGSSDNWFSLSKVLGEKYRVFTVDQRNHGQSPHTTDHDYKVLTTDLEEFISQHQLQCPIILGHSMGGKTAMNYAVKNPEGLSKLIVVDIIPKAYPIHHDSILEGLESIDLKATKSRTDADNQLQKFVPEAGVRQFLLKSLARADDGSFEWRINIPTLDANIEAISKGLVFEGQFSGPTLFIRGASSKYYAAGDEKLVVAYFPMATWITLDTGHWVHAEKPKEFTEAVLNFLANS